MHLLVLQYITDVLQKVISEEAIGRPIVSDLDIQFMILSI